LVYINFNNVFTADRIYRTSLNATDTSFAASAALAFTIFPTAFGVIYNNGHKVILTKIYTFILALKIGKVKD
jgi:hypothetical protein